MAPKMKKQQHEQQQQMRRQKKRAQKIKQEENEANREECNKKIESVAQWALLQVQREHTQR